MGTTLSHYLSSLKEVRKNFPHYFPEEAENVEEMIFQLHIWLDHYSGKRGEDEAGPYDFTGHLAIRHRAKRHHFQGINQAANVFSQQFGAKFSGLIRQEAERHIYEDMGRILFKEDYQRIGFWKNYE